MFFNFFLGSQVQFSVVRSGFTDFPNKVVVFGIPMFATSGWSAEKLNHAASIMAELLDQDEDGCADNQDVLDALTKVSASTSQSVFATTTNSVFLPTNIDDDNNAAYTTMEFSGYSHGQTLGETETKPECTGLQFTNECSDNSIEELFHFITDLGYAKTYPEFFGTAFEDNSVLTEAMDIARGGRFEDIPTEYPNSAWYTYNDQTCDYKCQATEYIWWGYCAFSGVCSGRSGSSSFENEFTFLDKSRFISGDLKLTKLIEDYATIYKLPTKPVDGKYHGPPTCAGNSNHGGYSTSATVGK